MVAGAAMALILALGAGAQDANDPRPTAAGPRLDATRVGVSAVAPDTERVRVRRRAVRLSEAYHTRLKIHKIAAVAMLPMFAFQYASGDQLMKKSAAAPAWARNYHGLVAGGVAGLFAVNTLTGSLNWWETRRQEPGRLWRTVHGALMLVADAGFTVTGALATPAENSLTDRRLHRTLALTSASLATVSYLMMLKPLRRD